jgi:hypothetical protein
VSLGCHALKASVSRQLQVPSAAGMTTLVCRASMLSVHAGQQLWFSDSRVEV